MSIADELMKQVTSQIDIGAQLKQHANKLYTDAIMGVDITEELGKVQTLVDEVNSAQQTLVSIQETAETAKTTTETVVAAQKAASISGAGIAAPGMTAKYLQEEAAKIADDLKPVPDMVKGMIGVLGKDIKDVVKIVTEKIPKVIGVDNEEK